MWFIVSGCSRAFSNFKTSDFSAFARGSLMNRYSHMPTCGDAFPQQAGETRTLLPIVAKLPKSAAVQNLKSQLFFAGIDRAYNSFFTRSQRHDII